MLLASARDAILSRVSLPVAFFSFSFFLPCSAFRSLTTDYPPSDQSRHFVARRRRISSCQSKRRFRRSSGRRVRRWVGAIVGLGGSRVSDLSAYEVVGWVDWIDSGWLGCLRQERDEERAIGRTCSGRN
ncbi:hypothetical protein HDK64DRAFT_272572 [Phyllosticta capitalensis]